MARSSIALFLAGAGLATALTGCSTAQPEGGEQVRPAQEAPAETGGKDGTGERGGADNEGGEGGEGGEG